MADDILSIDVLGAASGLETDTLLAMMPAVNVSRPTSALIESIWNEATHPRWPPGTKGIDGKDIGGQFMRAGQTFMHDGQRWDIHSIADGKIIANEASGDIDKVETRVFTPKQMQFDSGEHPALAGASVAPPVVLTAGKSHATGTAKENFTAPIVDGHASADDHDPSIPLPESSKLSAEDWKRFGKADQLYYREVMKRYGPWQATNFHGAQSSKVAQVFAKAQQEFGDTDAQSIVTGAIAGQKGSSKGYEMNLASLFKGLSEGSPQLKQIQQRYARARELQSEINGVIAYDLYNRLKAPDISVRHKAPNQEGFFGGIVKGKHAVMSGLSTAWTTAFNWGEPNTLGFAMPVRHVALAEQVTGMGWGANSGENELATADRIKVTPDNAAFWSTAQVPEKTTNPLWSWLKTHMDKKPAAGHVMKAFAAHLSGKEDLPDVVAEPNFELKQKGGGMSDQYVIPPDAFMKHVERMIAENPGKAITEKVPVNTLDLKPGDIIEGGTEGLRYMVIEDKGLPSGTIRYIALGKGAPGNYDSPEKLYTTSGNRTKIGVHFDIPEPVKPEEPEKYKPEDWAPSGPAVKLNTMAVGDKIRHDGQDWEITHSSSTLTTVKSLTSDQEGTFNPLWKTQKLVSAAAAKPKEGSLAIHQGMVVRVGKENDDHKTFPVTALGSGAVIPTISPGDLSPLTSFNPSEPEKGDTFAHDGKRFTVTTVLKNGTVKAKASGGGVQSFEPGHQSLAGLFRPSSKQLGEKWKLKNFQPGELFSGSSSAIRPYMKLSSKHAMNLDTGEVMELSPNKAYSTLKAVAASTPDEAPKVEAEWGTVHPPEHGWPIGTSLKGKNYGELEIGDKFKSGSVTYTVQQGAHAGAWTLAGLSDNGHESETPISHDSHLPPLAVYAGHVQVPGDESPGPGTKLQPGDKVDNWNKLHVGAIVQFPMPGDVPNPTYKIVGDEGANWVLDDVGPGGTEAKGLMWPKDTPAPTTGLVYLGDQVPLSTDQEPTSGKFTVGQSMAGHKYGDLQLGDKFSTDMGYTYQVTTVQPNGVKVSKIDDDGSLMQELPHGYNPKDPIAHSWKYKGSAAPEGPASAEPAPAGEVQDAVAHGGFKPFKSSHGPKGAYKHDKLKDLEVGSIFVDSKGKPWKLISKQPDDKKVTLSDGKAFFTADDNLRGKHAVHSKKPVDFKDEIGEKAPEPSATAPEPVSEPASMVSASDLMPGDVFENAMGGKFKVTGKTAASVPFVKISGSGVQSGSLTPSSTKAYKLVSKAEQATQPPIEGPFRYSSKVTSAPAMMPPHSVAMSGGKLFYKTQPQADHPSGWYELGHAAAQSAMPSAVTEVHPVKPDVSNLTVDESTPFNVQQAKPGDVFATAKGKWMLLANGPDGSTAANLEKDQIGFMPKGAGTKTFALKPSEPEADTEGFTKVPTINVTAAGLKPGDEFLDDDGDHHTVTAIEPNGAVTTMYSSPPSIMNLGPSTWHDLPVTAIKKASGAPTIDIPQGENWKQLPDPVPMSSVDLKKGDQFMDSDGDVHTVTKVSPDGEVFTIWQKPSGATHGPMSWGQSGAGNVIATNIATPKAPEPGDIPDYSDIVLVGGHAAGGTTGAQIKTAPGGSKWLLKTYDGNEDRIATELLANSVYRAMGMSAATAGKYEHKGKMALAYPLLDGEQTHFSEPGESPKKIALGKGFMTDVLIGNRDFAGLVDDNVLWNGDEPTRIDQGGTFFFRAQGAPKDFAANPQQDLKDFLTKGQGKQGVSVTEAGLKAQAGKIADELTWGKIDSLVDQAGFADKAMEKQVRDNLKMRVAWMKQFSTGNAAMPEGTGIPKGVEPKPDGLGGTIPKFDLPTAEPKNEGFAAGDNMADVPWSALQVGDVVHHASANDYQVLNKQGGMVKVKNLKDPGGQPILLTGVQKMGASYSFAGNKPLPGAEPEPQPQLAMDQPLGATKFGNLEVGDTFVHSYGDTYVITAQHGDKTTVVNVAKGNAYDLNSDHTVGAPNKYHGKASAAELAQATTISDKKTFDAAPPKSTAGYTEPAAGTKVDIPIEPYGSKWASGGKFEYPHIADLEPGQKFADKKGKLHTVVGQIKKMQHSGQTPASGPDNVTYALSADTNEFVEIPHTFTVKKGTKAGKSLPTRVKLVS